MRWINERVRVERDKIIVKLREQGLTIEQIAAQTNLTASGVKKVIHRAGEGINKAHACPFV